MSRAIDALVAERVMGCPKPVSMMTYREAHAEEARGQNGCLASCFEIRRRGWFVYVDWGKVERQKMHDDVIEWQADSEYSTDISAAWWVVEKFTDVAIEKSGLGWWVRISGAFEANTTDGANERLASVICRAALRAVGVSDAEIEEAMRG